MTDDQSVKLFAPEDRPAAFVDPAGDEPNERVRAAAQRLPDVMARPAVQALPCTGCVIDAKQAAMLGKDAPEPLPGTVMVNGMLLCDVRHTLNVGSPQLLIAQPGQVPGGLG